MSATFIKHQFNIDNVPFSTIKNYIDGLNIPIISTSLANNQFDIMVFNTYKIRFEYYSCRIYDELGYNLVGDQVMYNPFTEPLTFIIGYSDTFFYLHYYDAYSRGFTCVCEIIDNRKYMGVVTGGSFQPITSIRMKCAEDQNSVYFKKVLNYSVDSGNLDYTQNLLFDYPGNVILTDSNTVACTDVTQNKIITFNGNRYYSLGPNTLIQLND